MAFTIVFYALAAAGLLASLIADRRRTSAALKKAWKAFSGILPEFLVVLIATGLILAFLSPDTISRILGKESGWIGVLGGVEITLVPGDKLEAGAILELDFDKVSPIPPFVNIGAVFVVIELVGAESQYHFDIARILWKLVRTVDVHLE